MSRRRPNRRTTLRRGLLLAVGGWAAGQAGCTAPDNPSPGSTSTPDRNLEVGNTEVLALMIAELKVQAWLREAGPPHS